jgi:predicted nucleic acid-binding protein
VNVVDTSGWIEYLRDGPSAENFAPPIEDSESLVVPTIVIYEAYKRSLQLQDEQAAMDAVIAMVQGKVIGLDLSTAVQAARLSFSLRLPMADSIILATAQQFGATIWTQDAHFDGLPGVRLFPKGTIP